MSGSQAWFDDNRSRFRAETTVSDVKPKKCTHKDLTRTSATEVQCSCGAGWIDNGQWKWVK